MVLGGFETTCGSCHHHRTQIRRGGTVSVFGLPAVDLETLADRGIWIGIGDKPWRVDASEEDVALSPFMQVLLATEAQVALDLAMYADPELLLDLSESNDEVVKAAGRLVWAIKELVFDLLQGGEDALAQRLQDAIGPNLPLTEIDALIGQPADAPHDEHQQWLANLKVLQMEFLPQLMTEVPRSRVLSEDDESLLGDEDDGLVDDEGGPDISPEETARREVEVTRRELDSLRGSLSKSGRWFFDEYNFAVAYRPTGHADAFLRAWLTHTAAPGDTVSASAALAVFDELRRDRAPERCIECHSVDIVDGDARQYRVNWNAARPTLGERSFTKFVHRPHFNFEQLSDSDCAACHSLKSIDEAPSEAWRQTYRETDLDSFVASFDPISATTCTACHTPSGVGDGCLTCHNYHVGSFEWAARLSFSNTGDSPTP